MPEKRFPIQTFGDIEKLIETVYRLGYESGYYSHFDSVGWVGREKKYLFGLAERLGLLEAVVETYKRAKKKGEHDRWLRVLSQSAPEEGGDAGGGESKGRSVRRSWIGARPDSPLQRLPGEMLPVVDFPDMRDEQAEVDWLRVSREALEAAVRFKQDSQMLLHSGGSPQTVELLERQMKESAALSGLALGYFLGIARPKRADLEAIRTGSWSREMEAVLSVVILRILPVYRKIADMVGRNLVSGGYLDGIESKVKRLDPGWLVTQIGGEKNKQPGSAGDKDRLAELASKELDALQALLSTLGHSLVVQRWMKAACSRLSLDGERRTAMLEGNAGM